MRIFVAPRTASRASHSMKVGCVLSIAELDVTLANIRAQE